MATEFASVKVTRVSDEVKKQYDSITETVFGLPCGVYTIDDYTYVDFTKNGNQLNKNGIKALITNKPDIYVYYSHIIKAHIDMFQKDHQNGGEVCEGWRKIISEMRGKRNEEVMTALVNFVKGKELVVTEKFYWAEFERKDNSGKFKQRLRLVDINFKK